MSRSVERCRSGSSLGKGYVQGDAYGECEGEDPMCIHMLTHQHAYEHAHARLHIGQGACYMYGTAPSADAATPGCNE